MKNIKINFSEPIPKELEGKTLEEVFYAVKEKNHEIIEKIKKLTGGTIYTPEVEKQLTDDEIVYLKLAKMFSELLNSTIKKD